MLEFNITNQTLKRADKFNPATDSVEYLKAKFNFLTADWSGFTKQAIFRLGTEKYEAVLDSNGSCTVPHEVLVCATDGYVQGRRSNKIFVTVYGVAGVVRATTNEIRVDLAVSGYGEAENSAEPTPTVYEQLVNEVAKDNAATVAKIVADNDATAAEISVLTERAEAAEESALSAESRIRTDYANALKDTVSGEVIRVDDVSPVMHDLKVNVHGKNLIVFPYAEGEEEIARDGVTYTFDSDNGLIINGTPTVNTSYNLAMQHHKSVAVKKGRTYALTCWSNLTGARGYVYLQVCVNGEVMQSKSVRNNESVSFTATVDGYVSIGVVVLNGIEFVNEKVLVQLEENAPSEYEPYIDPSTVTLTRCGKNIFPYPFDGTAYGNGITFTDNGNGSVTINGTNNGEGNSVLYIAKDAYIPLPKGTYIGTPSVNGVSIMGVAKGGEYLTLNKAFAVAETIFLRSVYIQVVKGSTVSFSNVRIKPMLEYGDTFTGFESYKGGTFTPNADGTVEGITSVYPTMTLFTDTDGVTVECEYNIDSNAALETLNSLLDQLLNGGA